MVEPSRGATTSARAGRDRSGARSTPDAARRPHVADDVDALAVALVETARALTRAAARAAGPGERRELTGAQLDVLLEVAHNPDQTVTQLAERMQLARNTVSTLVGQLDDAGLVVRSGDRADARLTRLTVSATAAERMTGWRARRATAVRDALASLSGRDLAAVSRAMKPLRALIGAVEERQDAGVQASGKGE